MNQITPMMSETTELLPASPGRDTGADAINHEHRLVKAGSDEVFAHAVRCGELLAAKKIEVGHGHFMDWVSANCDFTHMTATTYMKAADHNSRGLEFSSLTKLINRDRPVIVAPAPNSNAPPTAHQAPPENSQSNKKPRAERIAEISQFASEGYNADQIAAEIGISTFRVRDIANKTDIKIPAGRTPRISAHRVIKETVDGIANYVHGLSLLSSPIEIDPAHAAEWIESINDSLKAITRLRKQLQDLIK